MMVARAASIPRVVATSRVLLEVVLHAFTPGVAKTSLIKSTSFLSCAILHNLLNERQGYPDLVGWMPKGLKI